MYYYLRINESKSLLPPKPESSSICLSNWVPWSVITLLKWNIQSISTIAKYQIEKKSLWILINLLISHSKISIYIDIKVKIAWKHNSLDFLFQEKQYVCGIIVIGQRESYAKCPHTIQPFRGQGKSEQHLILKTKRAQLIFVWQNDDTQKSTAVGSELWNHAHNSANSWCILTKLLQNIDNNVPHKRAKFQIFISYIKEVMNFFSKLELILNYLENYILNYVQNLVRFGGKTRCARDFKQTLFWACVEQVLVYYRSYGGWHIGKLAWKSWLSNNAITKIFLPAVPVSSALIIFS